MSELRLERQAANVSQRVVAQELDWHQAQLNRLENFAFQNVPLVRLAEIAALLGLELSVRLHRTGDPIRDGASRALIGRFLSVVAAPPYRTFREALLPSAGDRRAWDVLLRLGSSLVGVEAETRVRDVQALTRHIRERERDGGVDNVLLVLSDTAHNRRLQAQVREALGGRFETPPASVLAALRSGRPITGSSVILM